MDDFYRSAGFFLRLSRYCDKHIRAGRRVESA